MKPLLSRLLRNHWDTVIASVVAFIFIHLFTRHSGIGVSPDSVTYLTTAENIRKHGVLVDFADEPFVNFPFGYPFLLAAITWLTTIGPLSFAPVFHMMLFAGVLYCCHTIIKGHEKLSATYRFLFLMMLACSPCLLEIYSMLWSETVFIFLTLLFILSVKRYFDRRTTASLLFLSVVTAWAMVTRYAGVVLLCTGIFLIGMNEAIATAKKWKHIFLFTVISCSLLLPNLIGNKLATGTLTGARENALRGWTDNLSDIGITLGDWLPFLKEHTIWAEFVFTGLILFAFCIVTYRVLQQQFFSSFKTIITAFFLLYALFIITIASISRFEQLNSRLLSPLFIPLLLVGTSWADPLIRTGRPSIRWLVLSSALIFYAAFQVNQYKQNAEAWEGIRDAGMPGYAENSWRQSATLQFIRQHPGEMDKIIYANANDAVYFLGGIKALLLPHNESAREKQALLESPVFCIVMLNDGNNPDLVDISFVQRYKTLVSKHIFPDGVIYFFRTPVSSSP